MSVEVTVRFAGTLLDSVVVAPGHAFRLGTAPGVDLPIPGLTNFPLVDSLGVVRVPAGAMVTHTGEIVLGNVAISIANATRIAPIARPPIDRRIAPYAAIALLAHLGIWLAAISSSEPQPEPRPRLARIQSVPRQAAGIVGDARSPKAEKANASPFGANLASAMHDLIGTTDLHAAFENMKPVYREEDASASEFGGSQQKFDPSTRPGFESVKVGRYATVSRGRGAGDEYHLDGETTVEVELCASTKCVATGAIDRASVHSWIAPHAADFRGCFDGTANVLVDFTIANGVVRGAHGRGASGSCAAAVVSGIAFPHTDGTTRVRYEVTYRRS